RTRSRSSGPARAWRSSTGGSAPASPPPATTASPRTRSATVSAPGPTSRPTPTRRAAARSRRAWCSRSSPGSTGPGAAACDSRTTSSSPRTAPRSSPPSRTGSLPADRSLIWTGPINEGAAIGGAVGLYDTTLRDGEQTVGVVFDPEQKLELARAIDELGVGASVIESPISDGKLDALGVSRETMVGRIREAVAFAAGHGITVAYFGVDGTRADLSFFRQAY